MSQCAHVATLLRHDVVGFKTPLVSPHIVTLARVAMLGMNVATLLGSDEQRRDVGNERCDVVVFYNYRKHVKIPTL